MQRAGDQLPAFIDSSEADLAMREMERGGSRTRSAHIGEARQGMGSQLHKPSGPMDHRPVGSGSDGRRCSRTERTSSTETERSALEPTTQ